MQSPFLDEVAEATEVDQSVDEAQVAAIERLDFLIQAGLKAKLMKEAAEAEYDQLRAQVLECMNTIGQDKITTAYGKVNLKTTESGWIFSEATSELAEQLKVQQSLEKRKGIAKPGKVSVSANIFSV